MPCFVVPALIPFFNEDGLISLVMMSLTVVYAGLFFRRAFPRPTGRRGRQWVWSNTLAWSKPVVFTLVFAFLMYSALPLRTISGVLLGGLVAATAHLVFAKKPAALLQRAFLFGISEFSRSWRAGILRYP